MLTASLISSAFLSCEDTSDAPMPAGDAPTTIANDGGALDPDATDGGDNGDATTLDADPMPDSPPDARPDAPVG